MLEYKKQLTVTQSAPPITKTSIKQHTEPVETHSNKTRTTVYLFLQVATTEVANSHEINEVGLL
jgi:hypothetical protein